MSVSHKIVNVSVSHIIVICRVILRELDGGGQTMVGSGSNITTKHCQTHLRRGITKILSILWLTDISGVTYRHLQIYLNYPFLYLSQFEHVFGFALSVYFFTQLFPFGEEKSHVM